MRVRRCALSERPALLCAREVEFVVGARETLEYREPLACDLVAVQPMDRDPSRCVKAS